MKINYVQGEYMLLILGFGWNKNILY